MKDRRNEHRMNRSGTTIDERALTNVSIYLCTAITNSAKASKSLFLLYSSSAKANLAQTTK